MLPCLTLLLTGLAMCAAAGDSGEELARNAEEPWVTVTLEKHFYLLTSTGLIVVSSTNSLSAATGEKSQSWRPSIGTTPSPTLKSDKSDQDKDPDFGAINQTRERGRQTRGKQGDAVPSIQLQLQEAKRGKASQFFGLMGKRVGGIPLLQPGGITGYQLARMAQGLLSERGPSTEGTEEDQGSE